MTYTHYADMFISLTLGWIRGVTNWVWSMIRLGQGSSGRSFLAWFSDNWVRLVVVMMLACVALDWLIWLVRWRPYWLWFGKKRRMVNDMPDEPRRVSKASAQKEEGEYAHRAVAPQFHSQALPRHKSATPSQEDLFDVSPTPKKSAPSVPDDLFAVAPQGQTKAAQAAPKPAQTRSEKDDAIDWFE